MSSRLSRFRSFALVILFFFVHELAYGQQAQIKRFKDLELVEPGAATYAKVDEGLAFYEEEVHTYEDAWAELKPPLQKFVLVSLHNLVEENQVAATFWQMSKNWFKRKTEVVKGVCAPLVQFGTKKLVEHTLSLSDEASEVVGNTVASVVGDQVPATAIRQATSCLEAGLVASANRVLPAFEKFRVDRQGDKIRVGGEDFLTIREVSGTGDVFLGYKKTNIGIVVGESVEASLLQLPSFLEEVKEFEDDVVEEDSKLGNFIQKILGIDTAYAGTISGGMILALAILVLAATLAITFKNIREETTTLATANEMYDKLLELNKNMKALANSEVPDKAEINTLFSTYIATLEDSWTSVVEKAQPRLLEYVHDSWLDYRSFFDQSTKDWQAFLEYVRQLPPKDLPGDVEEKVNEFLQDFD